MEQFSQTREGLHIDFNVPIQANDGLVLRGNVYKPTEGGQYPVILSYGVYGKDLHFEDIYSTNYHKMLKDCPEVGVGSTNIHQAWEVLDPEKWCPMGYILLRVDSRGAGCSPGRMDPFSSREAQDIYDCIEWAAAQPWCNGKVGMCGISYYAVNAWHAAELQPPHLAAIVVWEGFSDYYRDCTHHGGILSEHQKLWSVNQSHPVQHGKGKFGYKSRVTGLNVSGDEELTEQQRLDNRVELGEEVPKHPLDDAYHRDHSVKNFKNIKVPLLAAANWGGQGLHTRGNIEGYMQAASDEKWLEVHGLEHWTLFYAQYGHDMQKQFLDHYLKGLDNGWENRRNVQLQIRHVGDRFTERWEDEFPLARTQYTKLYLDPQQYGLSESPFVGSASVAYKGFSEGLTFMTLPYEEDVEITGYAKAKLVVSSSTTDVDLFLVMRLFAPDMAEVAFRGTNDPNTPLAQGWLRASHRKLDTAKSTAYRPWHTHDEIEPLEPGKAYELDVEFYPTCIVIPKGYRLGLTIRGKDYVNACAADGHIRKSNASRPLTGCGPFVHNDPIDRNPEVYNGCVTVHCDSENQCYLQLPVIPK